MDTKKIDKWQLIPLLIVVATSLIVATLIRLITLTAGADAGTANLVFAIIIVACTILYLVISLVVGESFIPWVLRKITKRQTTQTTPDNISPAPVKEELPESVLPTIAAIKEEAERQYTVKRVEKLRLFLEYTHLVIGPYVSAEGLERLRDCIARYTHEEELPDGLAPIRTEKLSNFDLFHFGWNMVHYFNIGKKYEIVPWLQRVFANLRDLEPSYIKGKLYTSQTKQYKIPNTDDIAGYLARLKS